MRRLVFAAALFLAACVTPPTEMRVMLEPGRYAVSMSSTLGLGLLAIAESPPGVKVRYLWRADGGFFLTQRETTAEILNLGRETATESPKLFWSYDPEEPAALEKKPVAISVITVNAKNNRALARTDLTLIWDGDFVRAVH